MENILDIEEAIAEVCPFRMEYLTVSSKCDTIINRLKDSKSYPEYIKEMQIFQDNFRRTYWKSCGVDLSEKTIEELIKFHDKYVNIIVRYIDVLLTYDDICNKLEGKVHQKNIDEVRKYQKSFQKSYHRLRSLKATDDQIIQLLDFYQKDTIDIKEYFKKYL